MNFAPFPTCHSREPMYRGMDTPEWRPPRADSVPYSGTFRTCWYCGSIHPEDLIRVVADPAAEIRLEWADRKYGYPHKLYVDGIPNPIAGTTVEVGAHYADGGRAPIMGAAPRFQMAKFYSRHFLDEGFDADAVAAVNAAIRPGGLAFSADGDTLRWEPAR